MQTALSTTANAGIPAAMRKRAHDAVEEALRAAEVDGADDEDWGPDREQEMTRRALTRVGEEIARAVAGLGKPGVAAAFANGEGEGGGGDRALALDRDSVRTTDQDGRMHVAVTNISKACVNPYRGREIPDYEKLGLDPERIYQLFRDPEELEKAAPTFNGIQVLRKHIPVNAEDHQPWDVVGATGTDAVFEEPYLKNSMTIWERGAIDDVESKAKRELSCGYRYRADMTPGNFRGKQFDGTMRDLVANHIALVETGRAGPDVVVGDSRENLMSKPTRFAATTLSLTARALGPIMAYDAKITLPIQLFKELTPKNFAEKRPALIEAVKAAAKGKLALDADIEKVVEQLNVIGQAVETASEAIPDGQNQEMEKTAAVNGPEKPAGDEHAGLKDFLKGKGMGEDDINAAIGTLPKKTGLDEDPEEKKKREKAEADKKANDEAEAKKKDDEDKAKDAAMKEMVTKPAMDAAIKAASDAATKTARETERGIRKAMSDVRPFVGELAADLAFDSGSDVYRHALAMLGVDGAKTLHESALKTVLDLQPRAGAKRVDAAPLAFDAATTKSLDDRFGLSRIKAA